MKSAPEIHGAQRRSLLIRAPPTAATAIAKVTSPPPTARYQPGWAVWKASDNGAAAADVQALEAAGGDAGVAAAALRISTRALVLRRRELGL